MQPLPHDSFRASGAEKMEGAPDLYPLISLQIGDAQSHLSQAYLFFALSSYKFLILVDNHSWRMNNNHSTGIHLRELFATKCRTSPFKNTRVLLRGLSARYKDTSITSNDERKKLYRWASTVNSRTWNSSPFFSLMDLHVALHGFIVFQVSWNDIRGIDYFNILQMDTSMAFEVKSMRKWDFHSIHQASSCIQSWFSGTPSETEALWRCLMFLNDNLSSSSSSNEPLVDEDGFEDKFLDSCCSFDDGDEPTADYNRDEQLLLDERLILNKKRRGLIEVVDIKSMEYKDTILKYYFNNKDLPLIFKDIITSDLRLLTLLESGLPSWVIFLQSYPLFCKVYRPWMRPLVRTLYISISLITCMIGFYDLYKNVPLMKATVSHICGPLFNWIEDWDMISRIQYIGTMLFLQNFEKAMKLSLKLGRALKLALLLVTKPFMEPLQDLLDFTLPVWVFFSATTVQIYQFLAFTLLSVYNFVFGLFRLAFSPFMIFYNYIVSIAVLLKPILIYIWGLSLVPLRACSALGNHVGGFCNHLYKLANNLRLTSLSRLGTHLSKAPKPRTSDVSTLNSFGKELFSKVLRSLRSVMYGLVACLDACIRHRFSAPTHMREYLRRLSYHLSSRLEGPQRTLSLENSHEESSERHEHVN